MFTAEIHNLICIWLNREGRLQTVVSAEWFCLRAEMVFAAGRKGGKPREGNFLHSWQGRIWLNLFAEVLNKRRPPRQPVLCSFQRFI